MPWLADTNILVYRVDPRVAHKQERARLLLREGLVSGEGRLSYQAIVEFVSATSRPGRSGSPPLLTRIEAGREAEELMNQFPILYPTDGQLRLAIRGAAAYGMSWFDANMWACAEANGLGTLYSEDFQDGRVYGHVRMVDPFREGSR